MGDKGTMQQKEAAMDFLPRKVLSVLLVEADDSTRQIITALLRKCSYKVAAVADGFKAWETLKNKASDIDLVLTEVELPSISGFSLLTLIMEHDICKNIPVIMMSSHDSVNMVFKCMLKGAADFLIKPIRRNELRNLWQHVWRRHAISRSPQNLTLQENKPEVAAENNAACNNSSGSVASTQKNNECNKTTSEAQSTCTSPSLEAEGAYMENMQDMSKQKSSSNLSNIGTVKHEESTKFERESAKHNNEAGEKSVMFVSDGTECNKTFELEGFRLDQAKYCNETENLDDEVLRTELSKANPHINSEIHQCSDEFVEPSRGAIDLIATFDSLPKSTVENCSFNGDETTKSDFDTQLELTLRRYFPRSPCEPTAEERQTLNHSNASAFSWYDSGKLLQPPFPIPPITSAKLTTNASGNSDESHKLSENINTSYQDDDRNQNQKNMTPLFIGQTGQSEPRLPNGGHPIRTSKPVNQKESSPFPTSTSSLSNPESYYSERHHYSDDGTCTSDQNVDQSNIDCGRRHDSADAGQSAATSVYHDPANHNSRGACGSIASGSDGNGTSTVEGKNNAISFIDSRHRTSQREAALTKFRQKRKERCYEKKVRYQSRKRLAEQRPRVKGQFVRQLHNDHPL